jgi:hypothetical protein
MKLRKVWVAGGLAALMLGIAAEACATGSPITSDDAGTPPAAGMNCAMLSACCMTLPTTEQPQCMPALTAADDTGCGTFLATIQQHDLCTGASSSSSGSVVTIGGSSSTSVSTSTASAAGSSTSSVTSIDSGVDAGTGAGTSSGTSSGTGTGSGTSGGTSSGGSIPTTCAEANDAIGCCGPNGNVYYCTGSGAGGTTVTAKTCSSGEVCGWDSTKGYYYCVTTPGTAPPGDPIACQ